ncbi:MAG: tripartite tricarboxylate transporter substrate binding protein [Burkholderiales bacterium]
MTARYSTMPGSRFSVRIVGAALALLACIAAQAQYPAKPIRLVVPFPPGAGTDVVARLVGQRLTDQLGQAIVVENRVGAGGAIGAEFVANADADGYTLLFVASPFTTVPALTTKPPYDPVTQFSPVASIAMGPLVWVVGVETSSRTMAELLSQARAHPGKLTYGSAGPGSVNHLVLELFKHRTGTDVVHVPYKGIAPAMGDLIGGQISMLTTTISGALPHLKQGKLRVLAVTGARRSPMLPDVPTMAEAGVPGFEVNNYWGIVGPARMAPAIASRLNTEVQKMLGVTEHRERLEREGVEVTPGTPEMFGRFLRDDLAGWRALVQSAKLSFEP